MSQDRPDLSVAARLMSQYMSRPREEIVPVIKRAIRYLKTLSSMLPSGAEQSLRELGDWPCVVTVTGPVSKRRGDRAAVVTFKSTGEAELNASVKALSETIGFKLPMEETLNALRVVLVSLHVDASACKGMLLRHGSGRVKHLATKQPKAPSKLIQLLCAKSRDVRTPQILTHTRQVTLTWW